MEMGGGTTLLLMRGGRGIRIRRTGSRRRSPGFASSQALLVSCLLLLSFVDSSGAQSTANATTDPVEVAALNTILGRWGKPATLASPAWNISGEPCSGGAILDTNIDDRNFNPGITCVCSYNNGTTCHITKLKVYDLDVTGPIPDELQSLTFLTFLKLDQNYLTGILPPWLGNLTNLQVMSIALTALSGTVPKELGKLTELTVLSIGHNNFSGTLPSELGNLVNLKEIYINSCGVTGEFPASLANISTLTIVWAMDNKFTGKIPNFGANINTLRMQGNSFDGPIPSSFLGLTKLEDLRLGELQNVSSSLNFISNLTSLSTLILRNCRLTGTLPPSISLLTSLQKLDLSFNNLTGQLPQSLFSLSSLTYLFLGNNSLSGSLPVNISNSLLYIDLSYNLLSGTFPSWVSETNLELNLVANNFVFGNSNNSVFPSGLNCLQRDVPCNRLTPRYARFAVNCGDNKTVTSSDGTEYEIDNKPLKESAYFVTDSIRWAVSTVGSFADASNPDYIIYSSSQFTNTQQSELYQTSRISPSSLRYYGLGLENGNYKVQLFFAETQILNPPTWKSIGRRVFDIYIQSNLLLKRYMVQMAKGNLTEKDFDIRKAAGEKSFRAVSKEYIAPVTNNFLEIHFFWAGKGTCCVPTQGYYGASISAISVSPYDFIPTVSDTPPSSSSSKTGLIVGVTVGAVVLVFLCIIFGACLFRQRKKLRNEDDEDLLDIGVMPDTFTYAELRAATDDFSPSKKLGEGGFGPVFKGNLSDGRIVAVKQLSVSSNQGKNQFMTEIATISAVQHRNLVKLYGCCIEGVERLLVYEYMENKSLDQAIFGEKELYLDWRTRFEICLGTARGLAYLHEDSRMRIVHRDVKASNILLDADLVPKISDFGLAKLYDDNKTHISTRVAGTIGYLAPEYALRGHLTEKADVFGFGVVALEVLSGRPNSDHSLEPGKIYLLELAWNLRENKRELELVDPTLLESYDEVEAIRVFNVALLCTQASPLLRPSMSRVVSMLTGDADVLEVTSRPGYLTDWQFNDLSTTFGGGSSSETPNVTPPNRARPNSGGYTSTM